MPCGGGDCSDEEAARGGVSAAAETKNYIILKQVFLCYLDLLIAFIMPAVAQQIIPHKAEITLETKYPVK